MYQDVVCDLVRCGAMSSAIQMALVGVKLDVDCDNQVLENAGSRSCVTK